MKKTMDAMNQFLCKHARLEICYGFLFLAILLYFASLPHTGNILQDSMTGVILLFGLVTFLFRKDIPGIFLLAPYVLYTVNTFLTAFTMNSAGYRGYFIFLLGKGVACVLVLLYAMQIIAFKSVLPWRDLVRFSLILLGIALIVETIFKMNIFTDSRIPVTGLFGALNEAYSEVFFHLFFFFMILPESLLLNREKFIHYFRLFCASMTASVSFIIIMACIIKDLPGYTVFCGLTIPYAFIIMILTHFMGAAFRITIPVFGEEADRLFYSEEVVKLTKRFDEIVDNLEEQIQKLKELQADSCGVKRERITECICDLEEEKYLLLHCDLEYEDLDEIEEEIRMIVYQGTRDI